MASFILGACKGSSGSTTFSSPTPDSNSPTSDTYSYSPTPDPQEEPQLPIGGPEEEPEQDTVSASLPTPPNCRSLNSGAVNLSDSRGTRDTFYCLIVSNNPNLQGMLTLRHTSSDGDWDLAVGTGIDPTTNQLTQQLSHQASGGTTNELMWLPSGNENTYYVYITPTADTPSNACLVFHQFDALQMLGESMLTTLFERAIEDALVGGQPTQQSRADASRAISIGSSVLRGRDFGQGSYDLLLNEVSAKLQEAFGQDSWLFDFGIDYFGGYLEQSFKHYNSSDSGCSG
ncbi:MAG: hypothetical protein WA902_07475 [Thermosynechococcaceae cyanobacterium]